MLFYQKTALYSLLPDLEYPEELGQSPSGSRSRRFRILLPILILIFVAAFALSLVLLIPHPIPESCTHPSFRREWRTLNMEEKLSYISAAQCSAKTPSVSLRNDNASIHDEFALLHGRFGNYHSRNAAPFLPWHRYFIHVYKQALRENCDYQGSLPYWDWTLNHQDLSRAPVWNIIDGFGPSRNENGSEGVAGGNCVVSGPFAGLVPTFYEGFRDPHCLSRGMLDEETVRGVGDLTVKPSELTRLANTNESYFDFLIELEYTPHLVIPYILQDQLFYLHHARIDRLWWIWQHLSEANRSEHNGPSTNESSVEGVLRDFLDSGIFRPMRPRVEKDVMNTERGLLCYQYDTTAWEES
ncbi:uncharacterized protein TRUGW13939_10638 [Talaromyces rugulosus]|uniref:Tyrosinase copper-binding domain-containing protein n=1 Tax=Talaromyces rugulosus TaxID=121627 RepID=A0A7H8RBQ9_TALRU|nr:uncharacterized protein TRUGW13939_10638 [Talaromyces rugulosus]QKX63468.1 hypothetical protein TRUGW13939_10638 [Talaromyces rugulosus]